MTGIAGQSYTSEPLQLRGAGWFPVVLAVAAAYVASNELAPLAPGWINLYVLQVAFWLVPALLVYRLRAADLRRAMESCELLIPAAALAVTQIAVLAIGGLVSSFGWSPYSHAPLTMLGNLWFVVVFVLAREVCRWHIVDTLKGRSEMTALLAGWLVLSLTSLSPTSYRAMTDAKSAFEFAGSFLLPVLALQFLATYLLLRGSLPASIAYVGILMAFEWFSPILPDVPWMGAAIIGVLVPVAGLFVLQSSEEVTAADEAEAAERIGPSPVLLAALGLLVAVFWLNTGILGVKPMIVDGISMQPTYHTGDLVVTRKTDPANLKVGDIILYDNGARDVVHRIMTIEQDGQDYTITTLGDNNPAPDSPIHQDQIIGRVAVHVGKVGWPIVETKTLLGKVFN